jgi:Mrp family chromosome partitioning ATPase
MNSAELLMSDEMDALLDELSQRYDYIFIDTPPVMTVTDAMILAPKSSGTVLVVRQETSTYDVIDKTVDLMKQSGIKILGFIFKMSPESSKKLWDAKRADRYAYKYLYNYRDTSND